MSQFKKYPYIQPWRDGLNYMSAGYIELDDNGEVVTITELAEEVTFVTFGRLLELEHDMQVGMDCVGGGYLRLFTHKIGQSVRWADEEFITPEIVLIHGTPLEEINDKET